MSSLRVFLIGLRFHVKALTHSVFFLLTSVFMPLLVATVAYYMYKAGNQPGSLLYVSLGAAVYGIWSSTLFGSGGAIQWQRWQGTLEVLVSAPTPFVLVIAPLTLATSVIGIYSLASTLIWGRLVFGIPFHVVHWPAFVVAVPATILGLGLLGFVYVALDLAYLTARCCLRGTSRRRRGDTRRSLSRDMTAFARVFFVGGVIAYRGLFNWIRPAMYIPTMLIGPVFQILFFAYLGRYSKVEDDAFFVVGNAIQASAMSAVFAGTMTIANERQYQTLAPLLATPANRFAMFMGRAVPVIASGVVVSAWGFLMGWLLLDFDPPASSLPALAVIVVVSVTSCTAFGLTLGSIGMRARDVFMSANIAYYLMWLLCGVNIPLSALPDWLAQVGRLLPLTHGIAAGREVAAGASLSSVSGLVWTRLRSAPPGRRSRRRSSGGSSARAGDARDVLTWLTPGGR